MDSSKPHNTKAKLTEINSYITCYLCKGYYVDATTIVECLHSFCRSCIIKHLHANSYCPICEVMINTAKPNIKLDKTLQDIVYKLVPGLYAAEMSCRRTFWANHPNEAQKVTCPEARGQTTERIIFSPQDAISLSLEYTSDDKPDWNRNQAITGNGTEPEVPLRRYLQCPAMLRVEHLKKFICNKYSVNNKLYHVDILHKRVPLPDHYTLMDIAYIYAWKRNEPMKFFFRITDINLVAERFDYFEPSSTVQEITVQPTRCYRTPKHNNAEKKELALKKGQKVEKLQNVNKTCDIVKNNDNKKSCAVKSVDKNSVAKKPDNSVNKCKVSGNAKLSEIELRESKTENDAVNKEQCERKVNTETNVIVEENVGDNEIKNDSFKENDSDIANSKSMCDLNSVSSNAQSSTAKSSDTKVPSASKDSNVRTPKAETSVSSNSSSALSINNKNSDNSNIVPVKIEPETPEIDDEKSEFFKSIQLTARNTSPPVPKLSNPKPSIPELIRPKIPLGVKRKYVRKGDKSPNLAKKAKLADAVARNKILDNLSKDKKSDGSNKGRKLAPKEPVESKGTKTKDSSTKSLSSATDVDSKLKVRNIKDPVVRLMVSNLNRQASNLTKIVEQTDSSKMLPSNPQNQNERLQSLIDSCKINIPSSLSITLTESTRNEDGTILETKPTSIKPVQNYIEILKLPDSSPNSPVKSVSEKSNENGTDASKKDGLKADNSVGNKGENCTKNSEQNISTTTGKNSQKRTFQTMFEETVKRNESLKAQLYHIQNQAKNAELAKKAANCMKPLSLKTGKRLQSNALDLSSKSPKSDTCTNSDSSTIPSPPPAHSPNITTPNSGKSLSPAPAHSLNSPNSSTSRSMISPNASSSQITSTPNSSSHTTSNKRNILEIAHQLSKRSRLELEVPTLKIPSSPSPNSIPKTSPALKSPKPKDSESGTPKQIIINSNFSSGGSISIKNSPPKTMLSTPKMPIPRLPIAKAPTPKLNPPNIRNGGLLKYSNYAAKLAANSNSAKSPTGQPAKSPNSIKPESSQQSTTVQGLSPNQILEKYNITNLAQYNANLNQAQFAFQQALMMSHQIEMQRMQQNQNQKHWMNNPNILAHYENYVQSLKKQQNQVCSNGNKN